ncbi:MAG: hypothetical protein LC749_16195, partial [Actinobacteria bacterium]|nr:hypothetical protein [Actinomycetota bacterium]
MPRRAAAWAWDAISAVGVEIDAGLVRLPHSQAELSARFGWPRNDGRVAAYLRALGPAVVSRRDGVVLDCRVLTTIAPRQHASGGRDADPGANERALYLVSGPGHGQDPPGLPAPGRDELVRQLAAVDDRLVEVLWEQRELLRKLLYAAGSVEGEISGSADRPRIEGAGSAKRREIPRILNREEKEFSLSKVKDPPLTSLTCASGQARKLAVGADSAEAPAARDWEDVELPKLLSELLTVCKERGFPGLNNPSLALAALSAYTRAQVLHAQREVVRQVRAGQHFTSPVGLLVSAARSAKVGYFPPEVKPAGP